MYVRRHVRKSVSRLSGAARVARSGTEAASSKQVAAGEAGKQGAGQGEEVKESGMSSETLRANQRRRSGLVGFGPGWLSR
jgi:hypothetical protein